MRVWTFCVAFVLVIAAVSSFPHIKDIYVERSAAKTTGYDSCKTIGNVGEGKYFTCKQGNAEALIRVDHKTARWKVWKEVSIEKAPKK